MGAPAVPVWKWIDWNYKDLTTKVKLNQMMEDVFYAYQRRVKDGDNKKGLVVRVDPALPLQKVNILADGLSLNDIEASNVNLSADITVSGVGGLDTGTEEVSTWYSEWVIHNQTDSLTRAILSKSATSPLMPTNYTKKRRVGWVRNNPSGNFMKFYRIGDWVYYDDPFLNSDLQIIDVTSNVTVWTPVDCSGQMPSTSELVKLNFTVVGSLNDFNLNLRPTGSSATNGIRHDIRFTTYPNGSDITETPTNSSQSFDYKAYFDNADFDVYVIAYYDQI